MTTAQSIKTLSLVGALAALTGCAGMDDIKRLEQAVRDADAKAASAMAEAQAVRSETQAARAEIAKVGQVANEAKAGVEQLKKNPYTPQ